MNQRLNRLWPLAVLLGAWALFFWRFAAPAAADRLTYPPGDFTQQFGVFRDIAYRALVAGRLPLWADCLYSGYPFHADPQAQIFYPPLWVVFGVLRAGGWGHFPVEALVAEVLAHYLLISVFLYLFLRSLSLRPSASVLGALVFTYGGYLTSYPPLQTAVLETSVWLPVSLLWAGRLADTRRARYLALAAGALAVAFLAGHPQTFAYAGMLTGAYFVFRARQAGWRGRPLLFVLLALLGLTAALAAVQLLPSIQFVFNSTRSSVAFEQAANGFPFGDVLQFFITGVVSHWQPLYVGILPLGLAVIALSRRNAEASFWAGAAVAGLILSFGTKAVAYDVIYWTVPGLRLFRGQERFAMIVSLGLAVLAAHGAHLVFGPLSRTTRREIGRLLRLGGGLWLAALAALAATTYLARFDLAPADWQRLPDRIGSLIIALGLALLALALRARAPDLRRWFPAVFVGVAVLDLFAANRPVNVVPVYDPFPHSGLLAPILTEASFHRVQDDFQLTGHAGCAYGFRSVRGVTPYQLAHYQQVFDRLPESVRWHLLGVRYVVTWRQHLDDAVVVAEAPSAPNAPNAAGVTKVYRLAMDEPRRAFLAHEVAVAADQGALFGHLTDPSWDPFARAILREPVDVAPARAGGDRVAVARDAPGHIRLRAESEAPGVLGVSEAHFSGWRVTVDGQPAPLLLADGALLAVRVPAGAHEVEFVYRPPVLMWGGVISVLGLLIAVGLALGNRKVDPR